MPRDIEETTEAVNADPYGDMRHRLGKATEQASQRLKYAMKEYERAAKTVKQFEYELAALRNASDALNPEQDVKSDVEYDSGY